MAPVALPPVGTTHPPANSGKEEDEGFCEDDAVDVDLADDPFETTVPIVKDAVVEENGLIRVGRQSRPGHGPHVRSAPLGRVATSTKQRVAFHFKNSDLKLPGANETKVAEGREKLVPHLISTYEEDRDGRVRRHCDYNGRELPFTPGPNAHSMEAFYCFTVLSGTLSYHASPNVGIISNTLNIVKHARSAAALPALRALLIASDLSDNKQRQSESTWAYNVLINSGSLYTAFGTSNINKSSLFESWEGLGESEHRNMLEAFSTLERTPFVNKAVSSIQPAKLFRVRGTTGRAWPKEDEIATWDSRLPDLRRIAAAYGLDSDDFEFYLTIPSPRAGRRVLYLFHPLSVP